MRLGFDLDGTLITCQSKHCTLMLAITKAFDVDFNYSKYWKDKRSGLNNRESLVNQGISANNADMINKIWIENIENIEWNNYDKLLPRAVESLLYLKQKNHSLHLVSARNNIKNARLQLKILGIYNLFDTIDFVDNKSSYNKSFYFNLREINCYFGDTEADFIESKSAQITFYPVLTGMRSRTFFISLGLEDKIFLSLEQSIRKLF